jgi:hypothetical protein
MSEKKDIKLLKLWLDSEISILHIQWAVLLWFVGPHTTWVHVGIVLYVLMNIRYAGKRIAAMVRIDRNYLDIPKE